MPVVDDQAGALAEMLPIPTTPAGFLPGVHLPVGAGVGAVAEALPTHRTLARLLPGVCVLVLCQVGCLTKPLLHSGHMYALGAPPFPEAAQI